MKRILAGGFAVIIGLSSVAFGAAWWTTAPGGSMTSGSMTTSDVMPMSQSNVGYTVTMGNLRSWIMWLIHPADGYWIGPSESGTAGESIAKWDIVYVKTYSSNPRYYKYDADGTDKTKYPRGVALTAASTGVTVWVGTAYGIGRNTSWGQTANQDEGKSVYASTTAGAISLVAPTGEEDEVCPIGWVNEANTVFFEFSGVCLGSELVNRMRAIVWQPETVKYQAGTVTLSAGDSGKTFTNAGAAADVTFALPECTATTEGWRGTFVRISTSDDFIVDSNANDTLYPIVNTAGDSVAAPAMKGATLFVRCDDMGSSVYDWLAYDDETWTDND